MHFSWLMQVYVGLIGIVSSFWSAEFETFLQVSALASHWLEDCANFTVNNYTPHVISRNDKLSSYSNIIKPT